VIRKSQMILATALCMAVGVAGIAYADGATDQVSTVDGKVTPSKLPKTKYKTVKFLNGVTTLDEDNNPEIPAEPTEEVYIDYDDDIKIRLGGIPECSQNLEGTTTAGATALCGSSKMSSSGTAKARIPSFPAPNQEVGDFTVTVFHGVGNQLLLHAYSPTLDPGSTGANAQVVDASIVNSPLGGDFGKRLSVPNAPDVAGDNGALVAFNATLSKGIKARCHDGNKKLNYKANFVYDDASEDNTSDKQTCKVQRRRR
jgi:hypothetical protein